RRGSIPDRAVAPMSLGTMRCALPGKIVFLHHTLETFALRSPDDIDVIAGLKLSDIKIDLAFGRIGFEAKLAHKFFRLDPCLLEFAEQLFGQARLLLRVKPNLARGIAVVFDGYPAHQDVIARPNHGHGTEPTIGVVNAGHANL